MFYLRISSDYRMVSVPGFGSMPSLNIGQAYFCSSNDSHLPYPDVTKVRLLGFRLSHEICEYLESRNPGMLVDKADGSGQIAVKVAYNEVYSDVLNETSVNNVLAAIDLSFWMLPLTLS